MKKINDTQRRVLEYLSTRLQSGIPPSVREIGSAVGLKSTSSVQANLNALEEAGYILRDPKLKRSIRVVGQNLEQFPQAPLVGTVAAGVPILAVEQVEGYVPVYGGTSSDKSYFALRVKGDSMINAGILDGDIVISERTPTAANGEIVVAMLEDEATVKRFFFENGQFILKPENDDYSPIVSNEVSVLGKVISLLRTY